MPDQREAIAQALAKELTKTQRLDTIQYALADAVLPFIEAAEQRGYEHGVRDEAGKLHAEYATLVDEAKREVLAEARAKITALHDRCHNMGPDERPDTMEALADVLAVLDATDQRDA